MLQLRQFYPFFSQQSSGPGFLVKTRLGDFDFGKRVVAMLFAKGEYFLFLFRLLRQTFGKGAGFKIYFQTVTDQKVSLLLVVSLFQHLAAIKDFVADAAPHHAAGCLQLGRQQAEFGAAMGAGSGQAVVHFFLPLMQTHSSLCRVGSRIKSLA